MLLGSLADRLPPRRLIAAGYLLECVVAVVLGLAPLPVAASLGMVAGLAMLTPVFTGASNRLVAETLTSDAYVLGRSLSTVVSGAAQLVGLALGGVAVAALGPSRALLASAGCHLIVVGAEALVVPYSASRGFPASAAGLLLACAPAGMLLANLIVGRLLRPPTRERLVAPLLVTLAAPLGLLAAPIPLWLVAVALGLSGAIFSYSLGVQRRFVDALGERHRGQAFALLSTGLMTMQGIGPAAIGAVGQSVTIETAMLVAAGGAMATGCWWWWIERRLSSRSTGQNQGGNASGMEGARDDRQAVAAATGAEGGP
jgi:predicted MFS family arabinose efflux permease